MTEYKRNGFTLMEIGLCLLIISILVMVCVPLISNQAKKTDEYAYYMAYKTVEKMGSQIVAFGDPIDTGTISYNNSNPVFKKTHYIADFADKVFKLLNPKAYASYIHTSEIVSFPSYEYNFARVCLGNPNVVKDYDIQAGNLNWTMEDLRLRGQSSLCTSLYTPDGVINTDFLKKRFACPGMNMSTVVNELQTGTRDAESYCKWLAQNCTGTDRCNGSKDCYTDVMVSYGLSSKAEGESGLRDNIVYGECVISLAAPDIASSATSISFAEPVSESVNCSDYGKIGMETSTGDGGGILCQCDATHPVKALNNSNACCSAPASGLAPYYYYDETNKTGKCINCNYNAFNERTHSCCPAHSYYDSTLNKCVCYEGYTPNNADNLSTCTVAANNCAAGSHLENNICVSNPPIVKAERLCELIADNWNITTKKCNTFTKQADNVYYNNTLYRAITKNNTQYLSTKAVEGAFNGIIPNIVFANGQRMWILGDKSASIAGLSYTPDNYTPNINACIETTATSEGACSGGTNAFCKQDNKCYKINAGTEKIQLKDARSCCSTVNIDDKFIHQFSGNEYLKDSRVYAISGFTVFIDINGSKDDEEGGGTMWKDVFPFYVSSNGHVYPGYPLNAAKAQAATVNKETGKVEAPAKSDSSSLYQGGNSSALSTDVYYFEMSGNRRKRVNAYTSIPYARALCLSGNINPYTPYCQNLGSKFRDSHTPMDQYIRSDENKCYRHRCFVKVKNKIKFL